MLQPVFIKTLQAEIDRIDQAKVTKRNERVIEGFTNDPAPQAIIEGRQVRIFNSNDYLGLRHNPELKKAEHAATDQYGTGPGAVRFISGSLKIYQELEAAIAAFHGREAGVVVSSAFATNLAVISSLIKGQAKDSVVSDKTLIISDELNHRSIIDGIRVANMPSEQRQIFPHLQVENLEQLLTDNAGKYDRVVIVTDGVFSMLGEFQRLAELRAVVDKHQSEYAEGIIVIVDDCHGVAASGATGRGTEEVAARLKGESFGPATHYADVIIGTFGKGFGADGGYVVADKVVIDYLRESAATYIYSNSIAPATAGAALAAVKLVDSAPGVAFMARSVANTARFKAAMTAAGSTFAANSTHPIQPLLIADPVKTKAMTDALFAEGFLVTNINYPVVPKGKDEIRVQISAAHTDEDIDLFVAAAVKVGKEVGVI